MTFFVKLFSVALLAAGVLSISIPSPDGAEERSIGRLGLIKVRPGVQPPPAATNSIAWFSLPHDTLLNHIKDTVVEPLGFLCPPKIKNFNGRNDIRFVLYNKNFPQGVDISNGADGKLLSNTQIKFLIHGFLNSVNAEMIKTVKDAYFSREEDYNIITVDWSKGSGDWTSSFMNCVVEHGVVPKVGEALADFIKNLIEKHNVNILYVTLVGHSLGAHAAGIAAKKLHREGQTIPIIVGLDPVLKGFENAPEYERLTPKDAIYVEVIHTNPGNLGFMEPLGTADYYPNYGQDWTWLGKVRQPTCFTSACSHALSFQLFAESVRNPSAFEGVKCADLTEMKKGRCGETGVATKAFMGGPDMRWGKNQGIFRMVTKQSGPQFGNTTVLFR